MKKKDNKFKLTPEVRKSIKQIKDGLPPIPVFIEKPNGEWVPQLIKNTSLISKINEETGKEATYLQTTRDTRLVNHEVNLTQIYYRIGLQGLHEYAKRVIEFERHLNPPPAEPVSEAEVVEEAPHAVEPPVTEEPVTTND